MGVVTEAKSIEPAALAQSENGPATYRELLGGRLGSVVCREAAVTTFPRSTEPAVIFQKGEEEGKGWNNGRVVEAASRSSTAAAGGGLEGSHRESEAKEPQQQGALLPLLLLYCPRRRPRTGPHTSPAVPPAERLQATPLQVETSTSDMSRSTVNRRPSLRGGDL